MPVRMPAAVETSVDPLRAVRDVLDGADDALLGVAFVQQRGINLLERQLRSVGRARLVTTTVFGGTTVQGIQGACNRGVAVRVLNPPRGTFHPKLYVARHRDRIVAAVGSANLTSGLIANVEVVAALSGEAKQPPLRGCGTSPSRGGRTKPPSTGRPRRWPRANSWTPRCSS